ncbi:hypothetical protein DM793_03025 [Paenarthrobacter nitroguajacolicus]|nr:hypothetical protein [Paenarthrobacter nitroguajacolicus]
MTHEMAHCSTSADSLVRLSVCRIRRSVPLQIPPYGISYEGFCVQAQYDQRCQDCGYLLGREPHAVPLVGYVAYSRIDMPPMKSFRRKPTAMWVLIDHRSGLV